MMQEFGSGIETKAIMVKLINYEKTYDNLASIYFAFDLIHRDKNIIRFKNGIKKLKEMDESFVSENIENDLWKVEDYLANPNPQRARAIGLLIGCGKIYISRLHRVR